MNIVEQKAEQIVLASILAKPELFDEAIKKISPEDFTNPKNRDIFQAMNEAFLGGKLPTFMNIITHIKATSQEYFIKLMEVTPMYLDFSLALEQLREYSKKRKLKNAVIEMNYMLSRGEFKTEQLASLYSEKLGGIVDVESEEGDDGITELVDDILERKRKLENGQSLIEITTGYNSLNWITDGFHKTELTIIAARPAVGKTALILNFMLRQIKQDIPVLMFSLEMSKNSLYKRLFSIYSGVEASKINKGQLNESEVEKIIAAADFLESKRDKLFIIDKSSITINDMIVEAKTMKNKGIQVIYIDYLQLLNTESVYKNRAIEMGEISRNLKILAKELDVAVVAVAQLNREVEHRTNKRPNLADLRDSGEIEQNADNVWFLYREGYYLEQKGEGENEKTNQTELIISKHRNGPTGRIKLCFTKETLGFYEYEEGI
ncbi:MAG: DnaB-like helicase C-terminal domain-containing protein [Defluviitoga tunisiensis]